MVAGGKRQAALTYCAAATANKGCLQLTDAHGSHHCLPQPNIHRGTSLNQTRERYFEWTLLCLILVIGGILFYEALPFLNGALGAVTIYILLRRPNFYLTRRFSSRLASWLITITLTLFVMLPLSALLWCAIDLMQNVNVDIPKLIERFTKLINTIEEQIHIDLFSEKSVAFITKQATNIVNMLMSGINNAAINVITTIFLLFFLLTGGIKMERAIARCLPFNDYNKRVVINKLSTIVRSNAIGIPLLAVIQGIVATVGYMLCNVDSPIAFGILTGIASMIPVVGTMLVWIPLAIMQYFDDGLLNALYLLAYGIIIISNCDNVLRMTLQKRMANTHPLVTIFGVIAGLPLFGFMGLIFGPLLVAMFLLFLEMFVNQYIIGTDFDHESSDSNSPNGSGGSSVFGVSGVSGDYGSAGGHSPISASPADLAHQASLAAKPQQQEASAFAPAMPSTEPAATANTTANQNPNLRQEKPTTSHP